MDRPRLYVDFNELLEPDLVLLSRSDEKRDSSGALVTLHAGMQVAVYMDDLDEDGRPDPLLAEGIVERNRGDQEWCRHVKWCCRIYGRGIRPASEDGGA